MELSYAELFLLTWALVSSAYALFVREKLSKFVEVGTLALEACKCVIDDIADGKVTVKRVNDSKIEIVELKGENNV